MKIQYRQASWAICLRALCVVAILVSTTVQAAHFCGFRGPGAQAALELDPASSGNASCLVCLMAPSATAIVLLIALFVSFHSGARTGALQMRPRPNIESFLL